MPELPEIANRAAAKMGRVGGQDRVRRGILQPKMLNVSAEAFATGAAGAPSRT